MIRAYLLADGDSVLDPSPLFVDVDGRGQLLEVTPAGDALPAWQLPREVVELLPLTEALDEVRDALAQVKLSKAARAAVDAALTTVGNSSAAQPEPAQATS